MADAVTKAPRAFLSYSYDGFEHRAWVLNLATRLREDGIETILDKWELEPGDPLPEFMERAVRENDFVLIICTPRYKQRSDGRIGGVGYEEDIITAEVITERNQRKFKPILRSGEWGDSAPTWLMGKVYVDLRGDPYSDEQYQELLQSLLGTRPKPPPVRARLATEPPKLEPAATDERHVSDGPFEPLKILGIIEDEVGTPRNDGTPGCALYEVPFRFSRTPPEDWAELFIHTWDSPPRFTSMHRPGIAQIYGDRLVLDGTTIEEVQRYHLETLKLALAETNKIYTEHLARESRRAEAERARRQEQASQIREAMKTIKFD
jgi:hypothetical protein